MVAHSQDLRQLGGDHDDALAGLHQIIHDPVNLDLGAHVDTTGGLIENKDVGVGIDPLADNHLLLVAAGQLTDDLIQGGGLDLQGADIVIARLLNAVLVQEGTVGEALHIGQDQIGPHIQVEHQALTLTVLCQEGDFSLDSVLRRSDMYLLALDVDLAAVQLVSAEHRPHGLRAACADEARKAGDLARMGLKADIVQDAGLVEALGLQPHLALGAEFLGIQVIQSTAHHGVDEGVLREVHGILGDDVLAVTHDGHTVAELKELFQFM